ncbi:hypothetical protein OPV22_031004 [Ensete ventricosum]|uniref:BLOC-1-related complex subunit 7 n=1 Tax=Ensete ventricosum TaxID=4639 RepID=A0AAV8PN96_ENSVE|nr:hypothetical protein OPV22_031004 [Ensete ventricosum]
MAAAAARADGQEKVIAAAKHIVSSLATSKNAAEDMTRILSGFDNRLSTINDLFAPLQTAAAEALTSPRFSSASRPPRRWFFAGSPALRTLMSTLPPSIVSSPSLAELSTSTGAGAAEDVVGREEIACTSDGNVPPWGGVPPPDGPQHRPP